MSAGSRTVKADRNFEVVWDGAVVKYTASVPEIDSFSQGFFYWDAAAGKVALFIASNRGVIQRGTVSVEQGLLICFSGSMAAFFGVIDIAERPEVYYQCGQIGRLIGRSRNSWHHGKRKYLSFQYIFTKRKKTRICYFFLL